MKKIRKLTPATLKRIIAEEKFKLKKQIKKNQTYNNKDAVLEEIKALIRIKKMQKRKMNDVKRLDEIRRKIKKNLMKRL